MIEYINIDLDAINQVIDLKNKIDARKFKNDVSSILKDCLIFKQPLENPNCIIGETPGGHLYFDKTKIELHKGELLSLLDKLNTPTHFEDLKKLKSGTIWTSLRQQLDFFMALLNAAELLDYARTGNRNPELIFLNTQKER